MVDGVGDAAAQVFGDVVAALAGDEPAQLFFELGGVAAGRAEVEVEGDGLPLLVGQLTVEVVVNLVNRVPAVQDSGSLTPWPAAAT